MVSLWSDSVEMPRFPSLKSDIDTDVLIIGGGICGLLCAYKLHKAGVDCVLAERDRICGGTTHNTTAKITSQHGLIYSKLLSKFGAEPASLYLQANEHAINEYRQLCADIPCEFETKDNYVYLKDDAGRLESELKALEKIGFKGMDMADDLPLPFKTAGAVRFKNQGQFNPLLLCRAIAKELKIFEKTDVREIRDKTAITPNGQIKAKKIIVATHFPFINKHGLYFLKMYQQRSYVIALEGAKDPGGMYIDGQQNGISIRSSKDLLLVGGGGHRTGKSGGNYTELKNFAVKYYPQASIRYMWATQDCMSLDGVPYVGLYSRNTPDLFVATGFNKWGMTSAMAAADLLKDLVLGKQNPYAELFDPSRRILCGQLAQNFFSAAANLLTVSQKRCPHLGCALKWNACEHSWDCPCHGSRFNEDGVLLDNPATGDLKRP